jgi:hypothetical protein
MVPQGEVSPQSDEAVRDCGQTGARCLRFRIFPIRACIMAVKALLPFMLPKREMAPKTERLDEGMIELFQQRRTQPSELRAGALRQRIARCAPR